MKTKKDLNMMSIKRRELFSKYLIVIILLGMVLIMSVLKSEFLTLNNLLNIVKQNSSIIIIAVGVTMVIISGGIDVSSGSVLAFCGVVSASLAHPLGDSAVVGEYPLIIPVLVPILIGAGCGLICGLAISLGNIPPFIATLGMMSAARGAALLYTGAKPIQNFTSSYEFIGRGIILGIPVPILIVGLSFAIGFIILHKTKFGTYIYAIGSNEKAANVSGVNVKLNKSIVYTIAGAFTGVAAILLTSRTISGQPAAGQGYEMDAITGAIIGGTSFTGGIGTMFGTLIGALLMGVLNNGMTMLQIDPHLQQVVKGAVIIIAVMIDERKNLRI
jgi:ribose/xylose/arabinose/galactoside ABC-type transport system permease subunit